MSDHVPSPFFRLLRRVLSGSSELSPTDRLVAIAIAARFNPEGGCWPSLGDIARRTGLHRSTVQRSVARLCEGSTPQFARGLRKGRGHEHKSYSYRLVGEPAAFAEARDSARAGVLSAKRKEKEEVAQGDLPCTHRATGVVAQSDSKTSVKTSGEFLIKKKEKRESGFVRLNGEGGEDGIDLGAHRRRLDLQRALLLGDIDQAEYKRRVAAR